MMRCYISPLASQDLEAISDYFVTRNLEAGERLLAEFTKKCRDLLTFPKMGRSYDFIRSGLRGVPLDGYIVFYQVADDAIEILRVASGRQDSEALFAVNLRGHIPIDEFLWGQAFKLACLLDEGTNEFVIRRDKALSLAHFGGEIHANIFPRNCRQCFQLAQRLRLQYDIATVQILPDASDYFACPVLMAQSFGNSGNLLQHGFRKNDFHAGGRLLSPA